MQQNVICYTVVLKLSENTANVSQFKKMLTVECGVPDDITQRWP